MPVNNEVKPEQLEMENSTNISNGITVSSDEPVNMNLNLSRF